VRDLLVVGGGPAGLATAIAARQAGMQVMVLEPQAGVIDKACGEGLMPGGVAALARLGVVGLEGRPFVGIRYIDGERVAQGSFSRGPGLGVRRTTLHAALRARAEVLGVEVLAARVDAVDDLGDRVRAAGYEARWLVAADGLRSPIRTALGLGLPARLPPRTGQRRHYTIAPWSDCVEVYWSPRGEAYVTPVGPKLVGVALLWTGKAPATGEGPPFDRLLQDFPALAARLAGAAPVGPALGAGPFEQRLRSRVAGRVLLVGDAAGYLDPLTGEGIRLAVEGAEALVACLQNGEPQAWEARWWRLTRRYRWLTGALLLLARNRLTRQLIVPVAARIPALMTSTLGLIDG
jgi:flavin-dependent dehydrogenase